MKGSIVKNKKKYKYKLRWMMFYSNKLFKKGVLNYYV